MSGTLEVQNLKGQKAYAYGFEMNSSTNIDGATASPEADMKEDRALADKISKSFNPPRSVVVFVGKEKAVVSLVGKKYYVELTISNQVLATGNKVNSIKEFYSASLRLLKEQENIRKNTHAALSQVIDEYNSETHSA